MGKSIRLNTKAAAVMIVSCKETNLKKDTREIILAAQTTLEEVKRGIGKLRGIIDIRKINKTINEYVETGCLKLNLP
jgi:hypothetical protein